MRYIRKTGTELEADGKKQTKDFIDSCWNNTNHKYENLIYDSLRLGKLGSVLFNEQKDDHDNSFCCYCMRRLFLKDTEDKHKKNITYEHIVPHKIKSDEWESDKTHYLKFPNLNKKHITICFEGELTDAQKKVKITGMPYPHFVSYHNLVASCNGATFEDKALVNSHCCNNNRKEKFVMPIYLSSPHGHAPARHGAQRSPLHGSAASLHFYRRFHAPHRLRSAPDPETVQRVRNADRS